MKEDKMIQVSNQLYYLLPLLQKKIYRPFHQCYKNKLGPMQLRTMLLLKENGTLSMTELANEMIISKPQLTPIIDKLISTDLVERQNSEDDRRIVKICLTPAGHEFLKNRKNEMVKMLKEKLNFLELEDLSALDSALEQIFILLNKIP